MVPLCEQSVGWDGELVVEITKPCEYASVVYDDDDDDGANVVDAAVVVVRSSNCRTSSPYAVSTKFIFIYKVYSLGNSIKTYIHYASVSL